ncbi:MAG: M3 family metallopeptidase [Granulosicoccus sp.]|nr:M3 family metallopeptidase [Granulosicoccus sp.]
MSPTALNDWSGPFQTPEFSRVDDADFAPAFSNALQSARDEIGTIAENSEPPDFANTIDALELAGGSLDRLMAMFHTLCDTHTNDTRDALARQFSPELARFNSEITLNESLFSRINTLWESRDSLDLTDEQQRVLTLTIERFRRAGAALEGRARERYATIVERLSVLGTQFGQNLLADEKTWSMPLSKDELNELPGFVADAARAAGEERDAKEPVLTLSRSLLVPFLQFSPNRALRKIAYTAWTSRGANGGNTDNTAIAQEILSLRAELAELLGYDSYSDYALEMEMAKTPGQVEELLLAVWKPAKSAAEADARVLESLLHKDGFNDDLQAWDWHYYAEKRRKALHDLDEAAIKPYFQLNMMIEAAFSCASRLFDLTFTPVKLDLHHVDCRSWEVTRKGELLAVFIGDYFARSTKSSGAWCSAMRIQNKLQNETPIVINVCNFSKPSAGKSALLSHDDARTLFHEFGHALHQILSNITYPSISGTSVPRDFVELPSQLYEHWLDVPEVLNEFALHADTGEVIPQNLARNLKEANTYNTGFETVEYLASAIVDLRLHQGKAPAQPLARQAEILQDIGMPAAITMRHATPHFAHVFGGGYSSRYYSYLWAEVMDADAFAAFEQAGDPFDPELAEKLETFILSTGGSADPADLYTAFRGQLPKVDALLKARGLDKTG